MSYYVQNKYRHCIFCFFLFFSPNLFAITQETAQLVAVRSNLHKNPTWLKMLGVRHYGDKSAITSEDFFLAPGRGKSPKAELLATLEGFYQAQSDKKPNSHAQCKFKGRLFWLQSHIPELTISLPEIYCPEFDAWANLSNVKSISLVYVTGFLGNPASYYGHTLIKLNSKNQKISQLKDLSVNFGAKVGDNENMVFYILKGLFGGYQARFSDGDYFYHTLNYGENELRDIWEYELNLSNAEVQLTIGHLWELKDKEYTYYFTNRNCAHRMAEVISIHDGIDVIPKTSLWSMPQSFLQLTTNAKRSNESFISNVSFRPSRQSVLYNRYTDLDQNEKSIFIEIIKNINFLTTKGFNEIELVKKHRILDALISYFQFRRDPEKKEKDLFNIKYRKVLTTRFQLPPGTTEYKIKYAEPPHKGRKPSYLSASYDPKNESYGFKIRPAYYDNLDSSFGHVDGGYLSMAELDFKVTEGNFKIQEFTLVKVENVNKLSTGLPGDKGNYWSIYAGGRRDSLNRDAKFKPYGQVATGFSIRKIPKNAYLGLYLGAGLTQKTPTQDALFVYPGFVGLLNISESIDIVAKYEYHEFVLSGRDIDRHSSKIESRYSTKSSSWDFRLGYEKNISESFFIRLGKYW